MHFRSSAIRSYNSLTRSKALDRRLSLQKNDGFFFCCSTRCQLDEDLDDNHVLDQQNEHKGIPGGPNDACFRAQADPYHHDPDRDDEELGV